MNELDRRSFLKLFVAGGLLATGAVVLPGPSSAAMAATKRGLAAPKRPLDLRFRILWKEEPIGECRFRVTPARKGTAMTVNYSESTRGKVGLITAFSREGECVEQWRNGALESLVSTFDVNGKKVKISAKRHGKSIEVAGPAGKKSVPLDVLTSLSIWSKDCVSGKRMIDVLTGDVIDVGITRATSEPTPNATPAPVKGDAYTFALTANADSAAPSSTLWYDASGVLVGAVLQSKGESLRYERLDDGATKAGSQKVTSQGR